MAGNRLRIIRLVPQAEAFYGSDTYGDNTYGQRATDTADLQRYQIVPLGVTASERPMVFVRVGDTTPFRCRIMAFQSEYESAERGGTVLDLSGVEAATARLHESSISKKPWINSVSVPMTIDAVNNILSANFGNRADIGTNRTYRTVIALQFASGRLLTLPPDDSLRIGVYDAVGDSMSMG